MLGEPNIYNMANVLDKIRAYDGHLTQISSLEARIKELESGATRQVELETALNEGATRLAELEPLKAEVAGLRQQLSAEQSSVLDLTEKLKTAKAEAEAAASIRIGTQIGATMGVPAAAAPAAGSTQGSRPDFSKLKGIDKAVAVERWEIQQAKANNNKQTS